MKTNPEDRLWEKSISMTDLTLDDFIIEKSELFKLFKDDKISLDNYLNKGYDLGKNLNFWLHNYFNKNS